MGVGNGNQQGGLFNRSGGGRGYFIDDTLEFTLAIERAGQQRVDFVGRKTKLAGQPEFFFCADIITHGQLQLTEFKAGGGIFSVCLYGALELDQGGFLISSLETLLGLLDQCFTGFPAAACKIDGQGQSDQRGGGDGCAHDVEEPLLSTCGQDCNGP